ncbi:MAG TPA: DUF2911 domain-containing protein [Bryobacteraceae bacterium]|nr:DUF2911 domain-containing protein [Bryobacteraceae bacterium]
MMKSVMICGLLAVAVCAASDQSPSAVESQSVGGKTIQIKYCSPRVRGREGKIFTKDGLIGGDGTYPVWRAGADSATLLHSDADLTIGALTVPKGDHTLFVDISDPNNWVLVVNKQTGQWGLTYNKSQDLGRVKMTMSKPAKIVEDLKYTITDEGGGKGKLELAWEDHVGAVNFTAK